MQLTSSLYSYNLYPPQLPSYSPELRLERLVLENLSLFQSGNYFEHTIPYTETIPVVNIGMDRFMVCSTNTNKYLGAVVRKESIVVCGIGRNSFDLPFLALAHTSSLKKSPNDVLFILNAELKARGCIEKSTDFYLIGGNPDTDTSFKNMQDFLDLAKQQALLHNRLHVKFEIGCK